MKMPVEQKAMMQKVSAWVQKVALEVKKQSAGLQVSEVNTVMLTDWISRVMQSNPGMSEKEEKELVQIAALSIVRVQLKSAIKSKLEADIERSNIVIPAAKTAATAGAEQKQTAKENAANETSGAKEKQSVIKRILNKFQPRPSAQKPSHDVKLPQPQPTSMMPPAITPVNLKTDTNKRQPRHSRSKKEKAGNAVIDDLRRKAEKSTALAALPLALLMYRKGRKGAGNLCLFGGFAIGGVSEAEAALSTRSEEIVGRIQDAGLEDAFRIYTTIDIRQPSTVYEDVLNARTSTAEYDPEIDFDSSDFINDIITSGLTQYFNNLRNVDVSSELPPAAAQTIVDIVNAGEQERKANLDAAQFLYDLNAAGYAGVFRKFYGVNINEVMSPADAQFIFDILGTPGVRESVLDILRFMNSQTATDNANLQAYAGYNCDPSGTPMTADQRNHFVSMVNAYTNEFGNSDSDYDYWKQSISNRARLATENWSAIRNINNLAATTYSPETHSGLIATYEQQVQVDPGLGVG
jgi:hypothetical protein